MLEVDGNIFKGNSLWLNSTYRTWLDSLKSALGCQVCGWNGHPVALQFHHLRPYRKRFSICAATNSLPWELLLRELRQCALICHNCHDLHHAGIIDVSELDPIRLSEDQARDPGA
jgi:hypothetical protein